MHEEIQNVKNQAVADIMEASDSKSLEEVKITYLGRNGKINKLLQSLKEIKEPDEKKEVGRLINEVKQIIEKLIYEQEIKLKKSGYSDLESIDLSIPGKANPLGHLHPQTFVLKEIIDIFKYLGYQVTDGPEIETDYYNFEALNIGKDHPARDTQQTFYIDTKNTKFNVNDIVLRTQTSSMQGRVMEKMKPPFRILVPGRCYRYEQVDASHGFEFFQVEGFMVDKNVRLTDLFGTIDYVIKGIFGDDQEIKFATTNFPFVEPGVDTYMKCTNCSGKGCPFCKKTGWSEIMPAGMIHPNVLEMAKIDSKVWNGFAFAIGMSRVVNLSCRVADLRTLRTPDMRIVNQFDL